MELSHPLKTLSFPCFCQVTHETFPMLILSTHKQEEDISCSVCINGLTWFNSDVSLNILKPSLVFSLRENISQEKKKKIPHNPKFQAQAGILTHFLDIFRVFPGPPIWL